MVDNIVGCWEGKMVGFLVCLLVGRSVGWMVGWLEVGWVVD